MKYLVTDVTDQVNADYVQFLEQAQLTDDEAHALDTDTWYDFPSEA